MSGPYALAAAARYPDQIENPGEDVDDRWVALVTVEPNMTAWRHGRATDPQLAIFDSTRAGR
jgi:hypothetical protein